jgi:hypothetical protein
LVESTKLLVSLPPQLYVTPINYELTYPPRYNELPPDSALQELDNNHPVFSAARALIAKYNLHTLFKIRQLHHHETLNQGHIRVSRRDNAPKPEHDNPPGNLPNPARAQHETTTQPPSVIWTAPEEIEATDLQQISGLIFSVPPPGYQHIDEGGGEMANPPPPPLVVPSEFVYGQPAVVAQDIDPGFFAEFSDLILSNDGWASVLGLERLYGPVERMVEFSLDSGANVLVREKDMGERWQRMVQGKQWQFLTTGWAVSESGGVNSHGETRCVITGPAQHGRVTSNSAERNGFGISRWEEMVAM